MPGIKALNTYLLHYTFLDEGPPLFHMLTRHNWSSLKKVTDTQSLTLKNKTKENKKILTFHQQILPLLLPPIQSRCCL